VSAHSPVATLRSLPRRVCGLAFFNTDRCRRERACARHPVQATHQVRLFVAATCPILSYPPLPAHEHTEHSARRASVMHSNELPVARFELPVMLAAAQLGASAPQVCCDVPDPLLHISSIHEHTEHSTRLMSGVRLNHSSTPHDFLRAPSSLCCSLLLSSMPLLLRYAKHVAAGGNARLVPRGSATIVHAAVAGWPSRVRSPLRPDRPVTLTNMYTVQ
jgi:hypothetical protein